MSEKYKATFTDDQEKYTWVLSVIDTDYESYSDRVTADGGTVIGIGCLPLELNELVEFKRLSLGPDGFTLEYGNRGDDPFKPLKGSRVVFNFMAENNADLSFIDDVAGTQEQRFYIRLYRDGSLFWQGPILQDLLRVPYTSFPAAVEVQAICGIARIKNLDGELTQRDNLIESTISILKQLDPNNLWSDTDTFLRTSVRWFEDQMYSGSPSTSLDAYAYTQPATIGTEFVYDEQGEKDLRNYYEYLESVLTNFGARLFLANGHWVVEQITEIANTPSRYALYQKNYSLAGGSSPTTATGVVSTGNSFTTYVSLSGTGLTNRISSRSSYGYLGAVKNAKIVYDIGGDVTAAVNWIRVPSSYTTIRTLETDPDAGIQISLKPGWHKFNNSSVISRQIIFVIKASIRISGTTTQYLAPGVAPNTGVWTSNPATILVMHQVYNIGQFGTQLNPITYHDKLIKTTDIPIDGDLEVKYEVEILDGHNPTQASTFVTLGTVTGGIEQRNRGLQVITTLSNPQNSELTKVEYEVLNTVETSATIEQDYREVYIADQVNSTNVPNKFRVWNVVSAAWLDSIEWKPRGNGTAKRILELFLQSVMQMREAPRRLFDIEYFGDCEPILGIRVGTGGTAKTYLWNWFSLSAKPNLISSEAFELNQSATVYNVSSDDVFIGQDFASLSIAYNGTGNGLGDTLVNGISAPTNGLVASEQSGTITSIPLSGALRFTLGFAGDTIQVIETDGNITEFVLSENALVGQTSLSIESTALSGVLSEGARVLAPDARNATVNASLSTYDITRFTLTELLLLQEGGGFEDPSDIQAWLDFSAGGHNFSAVDVAMTEKGKFATIFNGTSSYLANSTLDIVQPFTIAFAINLKETNTGRYIISSDGSTGKIFDIYTGTGDNVTIRVGATTATATITRDQFVVFQLVVNGASSKYRQNLDSYTSLTLGADHIKHPTIGYDGSSGFCEMDLTAVCIFERVLTDDELDGLFINLEARI